jgi:hypothetical protein
MVSSLFSLPRLGPIAGLAPGGIGAETISRIEIGIDEMAAQGRSALVRPDTQQVLERFSRRC